MSQQDYQKNTELTRGMLVPMEDVVGILVLLGLFVSFVLDSLFR